MAWYYQSKLTADTGRPVLQKTAGDRWQLVIFHIDSSDNYVKVESVSRLMTSSHWQRRNYKNTHANYQHVTLHELLS